MAIEKSASTPSHSPDWMSIQLSGGMLNVPTRMNPRSLISCSRSAAPAEADAATTTVAAIAARSSDRPDICSFPIDVLSILISV